MKLLMTGGTGLIARRFIDRFPEYDVTVLTRSIIGAQKLLPQRVSLIDSLDEFVNLDDFDGVVNLAGEPIIDHRWTLEQKAKIRESRWRLTQTLVSLINAGSKPPKVFLSGSAVGIYGDQGETVLDETSEAALTDFASDICFQWERFANQVNQPTRCVTLRTGIVLDRSGGALSKMMLPFKLCLGGRLGLGKQYMPWIHIDDMTSALNYLLTQEAVQGPVNLVAPNGVSNSEFTKTLGRVLKRVTIIPVPAWFLKLVLGEASILLLGSQHVVPKKLLEQGFVFRFPELNSALADLL